MTFGLHSSCGGVAVSTTLVLGPAPLQEQWPDAGILASGRVCLNTEMVGRFTDVLFERPGPRKTIRGATSRPFSWHGAGLLVQTSIRSTLSCTSITMTSTIFEGYIDSKIAASYHPWRIELEL